MKASFQNPVSPITAEAELWLPAYRQLISPGQVAELRAVKFRGGSTNWTTTQSGFFDHDHLLEMAKAAIFLSRKAKGVYFTLNPVQPDLLARRCNRFDKADEGELTKDKDIVARRWLLVDADPARDAHISATDAEKAYAREMVQRVRDHLAGCGWPAPVLADSGNGYHLLYRVDLPAADGGVVEAVLKALATRFDTGKVKIDTSVHNPARICKLPGTWARKGDSTPTRPHRQAQVLEAPLHPDGGWDLQVALMPLLVELAAEAPLAKPSANGAAHGNGAASAAANGAGRRARGGHGGRLDVGAWLAGRGVAFRVKPAPDGKGRTVYVLKECPFDAGHGDPDACIMQDESGKLSAKCFHNSCQGRGWKEFKARIGAPGREEPNASKDAGPQAENGEAAGDGEGTPTSGGGFQNFFSKEVEAGEGTRTIHIGFPAPLLHRSLQQMTGGWPKQATGFLFAPRPDHTPVWMRTPTDLFSWLGGQLRASKENRLVWRKGPDMVSEGHFHAFALQNVQRFDAVEVYPHHPALPNHYYLHPPLLGGDGSALNALIDRFTPSTLIDRDLIEAAILTPFAGIEPGQRPAFLVSSEAEDEERGRGVGKTTFVELVSRLAGGHVELRANDDWDRFVTRLLSPGALTKRVALVDNVKSHRFSWADLEGGITTSVISGRQLYVGEGRRPNTLTYFITLNGANLSKDLAQRCVPIILKRPEFDASWEEQTIALIESRRWEIIGDIIARLREPAPRLARFSRWSMWEQAVLARVAEPADCQKVIEERQGAMDDDQDEADLVRLGLRQELKNRRHDPDLEIIRIPSCTMGALLNKVENKLHRPFNQAMAHLYALGVPEIRRSRTGKAKGCMWTGLKAPPGQKTLQLRGTQAVDDGD